MKRVIISVFITVLIINTTIQATSQKIENNLDLLNKKIIYVDDDNVNGPWNGTKEHPYRYITDGILNSTNGDLVYVFNGIYNETLKVNNSIILNGENKSQTLINGAHKEEILNLSEDRIELINFTIRNSGGHQYNSAIKINSNNNIIKNCEIYRTKIGVLLKNSINNEIDNCTFHTNGEAILFDTSDKNTVTGCVFAHNSIGFHFEKSNYNNISHCYLYENGISFYLNNTKETNIFHSNISDNSVNLGGIFIENSFGISVYNSIIRHNGQGISISSSNEISITNCDLIQNTHYAISMRRPSKNVIVNSCEISNNLRNGILIEKFNSCKIKNNNIHNNELYGIYSSFTICKSRLN